MEKITVYGLPINPMPKINELATVSPAFCVSYFTRDKLGRQLDMAIDLVNQHDGMLLVDNGAFSAFKAGRTDYMQPAYIQGFEIWANEILDRCPGAVAVIPDVIGGTLQQNAELVEEYCCIVDPDRAMPIWHTNEPISYLLRLCEDFNYVGIGSAPAFEGDPSATPGSKAWHARMTEVFAAIDAWELDSEGAYIRPRIHLMRAQSCAHLYPVDSSDSTNVAVNHNRQLDKSGETLVAFASRIDSKIQASAGAEAEHQIKRPKFDVQAALDAIVRQGELAIEPIRFDIAEAAIEGGAIVAVTTAGNRFELAQDFTGREHMLPVTLAKVLERGSIDPARWDAAPAPVELALAA